MGCQVWKHRLRVERTQLTPCSDRIVPVTLAASTATGAGELAATAHPVKASAAVIVSRRVIMAKAFCLQASGAKASKDGLGILVRF